MSNGSHYTVLARRFRPQAFDEVIGQEHVSQALRNAIRSGRVAHAYLFTGARGVGKTSTARILAKALNCPNAVDGVPCNHCEICDGVSAGNDVDVIEIDGASNRGIDDIRSLRANVGVRSMRTRYKVYIIDEVHMLTKEAFNALLKTLEEPPPNVKFVFCTTEPNKVPDTILSRCQRFDFSTVGEASIAQRLAVIAAAEGFEVTEEALELVARRARGSMRDSQSLFDQLLAFSSGTVNGEDVHRMLGTADDARLVELFTSVVERRPGELLKCLDLALEDGVQVGEIIDQCILYVRDLMVLCSGAGTVTMNSVSSGFRPQLELHAQRLGIHSVMAAFQILAEAKNQMFRSTFARTILEVALVQVSLLESLSALSDLLSGRLPALPELPSAAPAGGHVPSANQQPAAAHPVSETRTEDAPEKKKRDELLIEEVSTGGPEPQRTPSPVSDSSEQASDPSESDEVQEIASAPKIEWHERNAQLLHRELIQRVSPGIAAALRQAVEPRISQDGRFEITLSEHHAHAASILDQPETISLLVREIGLLTGQTATLILQRATQVASGGPEKAFRSQAKDSGQPAEKSPESPPSRARERNDHAKAPEPAKMVRAEPAVNLLESVDPAKDPFVQHVLNVFGAKVVRVMPSPGAVESDVSHRE